ncbi:hypothetical protein O181_131963 [Austropuccinia psidii MF-1]|uniref:Uncharacterized protein n=1 Tax=Austropuccinia psidii MF-1 TaxID=1389203 RepID=A0A9Q3QB83_9BASI|nr:hypothetical protein [Austropuccinia psidii MF-1]
MSWFVALFQDADSSHANPYACAGSDNAKSSLCLCGLPMLHTPILMPVQVPNNSHANPYACAGSRQFTHQSLPLQRFPKSLKIPYACRGFQRFTFQSLRL